MLMIAPFFLASARSADSTGSNFGLVLTCIGAIAGIAIAAFVPFRIAASSGRRRGEGLAVLILLWAMIASASAISTALTRAKWAEEYAMRLQSGYYEPADAANDAPGWPRLMWAGLGVGYGVLLVASWRN